MAVSGVTGGSSIYGNRNVLSGLASGMDTESMIQNMTQATRLKIAQQNQKKTMLGWKQTAYQGISTQLIDFSKKYLDYTSPTNLLSSAFFDQSIVTSVGKNSGLVSASGKGKSNVEVNGVKQLATSASHTAAGSLSSKELQSGEFDVSKDMESFKLAGGTLTFQYSNEKYTITLDKGAELKTTQQVKDEITKQLKEIKVGDKTLADKISVTVDGNKLKFESTDKNGNEVKLTGASTAVQDALGLKKEDLEKGIDLKTPHITAEINKDKLVATQKTTDFLVDKKITLSLNGQKKEITLLTKEEADKLNQMSSNQQNQEYANILTGKLQEAFGDKIEVKIEKNANSKDTLKFDVKNKNDILKVTNGDAGIIGENSIFGFKEGDGNRLNMNSTLKDLGVNFNGKDEQELIINGKKIGTYKQDATLGDIMRDINDNKELGISATYSETSQQFVLTSKETGSNSKIEITDKNSLAGQLFGEATAKGQDAIVDVTVNGKQEQLIRSSNEIDIDGLKVTVSGTFGKYDAQSGKIQVDKDETVTFTSKPDTEKVFDAIKSMVEDYNKIVDSVYKELTTKPNRDYKPLTDEQKKEMTEEQIEKWEEKAKEGILFGDTQLRSLHDSLRFVFNPGGEAGAQLREMGFEPAKELKDGGKIKLDEAKLKAALEADPEKVKNAFSALASEKPDPNSGIMNSASKGGVMTQMKDVTDRFASTSITKPGILVAHAGTPSSPNSMMKNAIQKEMDSIDKILKSLDTRLKKEVDRYNSQFTQLEMLISQMNAQSGQLAGLMGGGMM